MSESSSDNPNGLPREMMMNSDKTKNDAM